MQYVIFLDTLMSKIFHILRQISLLFRISSRNGTFIYLVCKLVSESFIYHNQQSFVYFSFTAGKRPIFVLKVHATFIVTSKLFSDKVILKKKYPSYLSLTFCSHLQACVHMLECLRFVCLPVK